MSISRKDRLRALIADYIQYKDAGKLDLASEETIRSWLNAMLKIFDWDVRDTSQILQEKALTKSEKTRLKKIGSTNTRPDYTLKLSRRKLTFLDAKGISVDLKTDSESAFQIKSYGWSILAPCAFVSNFEQLAIYDCTYIPDRKQGADFGRIFLSMDQYIENFEVLEDHLLKENIYKGKLSLLYSESTISGAEKITPDFAFAGLLSKFRLELANNIFVRNPALIDNNLEFLSYAVQVIINRVLFIRVCEARNIEDQGVLLSFKEHGFWQQFKQSSYFDFYEHYDGPLFERVDAIHNLQISDEVFEGLLQFLYYPSPYQFDVIPTKLLSDIYEIFLSKKLQLQGKEIRDALKPEYAKTKGAVSTPQFIVGDIIRRTLRKNDLLSGSIAELLNTKVLDIACGSGVFAIEVYDYLEDIIKVLYERKPEKRFAKFFLKTEHELLLNIKGKKAIIENCIFGVDIDPEAVEVAKMSLALKIIDNADHPQVSEEVGLLGKKILDGVGANIRCGNSLVDSSILEEYPELLEEKEELFKINSFDWISEEGFIDIFESKGGFDYVIGNPPYVEVKNYNAELPYMHQFIKARFLSSKNGKVDLAIPFIERGISLLNETGRLGFIVQKRFFKTNYGKKIRAIIAENNLLSSVIDFQNTSIFKGRITFVSILILDKSKPDKLYYKLFKEPLETLQAELPQSSIPEIDSSDYYALSASSLSEAPWNFDDPTLIAIRTKLLTLGTLGNAAKVKVGIQALWDRAYHIRPISIQNQILTGKTHLEHSFQIELDACRPLICNEKFHSYRTDNADVYVIFPYDVSDGGATKIPFSAFAERFPLASSYLLRNKKAIEENVETLPKKYPDKYDSEHWHLFTREQNHKAIYPKVLIPMTALDTFAAVSERSNVYCDNVNVNFIELIDKTRTNLYAMSGILNSTVFSVLARSIANPQTNGYFKFNKQFLEPIPFPVERFLDDGVLKTEVAQIASQIEKNQSYLLSKSPVQRRTLQKVLQRLWNSLDDKVYEFYGLNDNEVQFFRQRGRNVNRIEFLNH